MSKPPRRGKLRNPPKGRQYAYVAVVIVLLAAGVSGAFLYTSHVGPFKVSSTSTSVGTNSTSISSSSLSSSSSTTSTSSSITPFVNTPCSPSSTSVTTSGSSNEYALICTNLGLIEVELYPQYAPKTVANFVSLADSGFYSDLVWHRIVPGFVIQTGDPNTKNGGGDRDTWGQGTSSTQIPFENDSSSLHNVAGSVAMASTGAGVGGSSQFYINLVDNPSLDGSYTVFGQVISGMSVVNALAKVPINTDSSSAGYDQPISPSSAYVVSITIQSTP